MSVLEGGYGEFVAAPKEVVNASGIKAQLKRDNLAKNCSAHLSSIAGL